MSEEKLLNLSKIQLETFLTRVSNEYRNHCELREFNKFIETLKKDGEWINYKWETQL